MHHRTGDRELKPSNQVHAGPVHVIRKRLRNRRNYDTAAALATVIALLKVRLSVHKRACVHAHETKRIAGTKQLPSSAQGVKKYTCKEEKKKAASTVIKNRTDGAVTHGPISHVLSFALTII